MMGNAGTPWMRGGGGLRTLWEALTMHPSMPSQEVEASAPRVRREPALGEPWRAEGEARARQAV